MIPPKYYNVLDKNHGFTAYVTPKLYSEAYYKYGSDYTLYRLSKENKKIGRLVRFDEHSFYQLNDDVTIAYYVVAGYRYHVVCWFDNKTGERIA